MVSPPGSGRTVSCASASERLARDPVIQGDLLGGCRGAARDELSILRSPLSQMSEPSDFHTIAVPILVALILLQTARKMRSQQA
jgi:hypothetical protein